MKPAPLANIVMILNSKRMGKLIFLLALSSMGITAGYHRLWAHRAYEASLPLKILLMIGGTFAVQNSILFWASSGHRTHHRHVDDVDEDPYSIERGFWYAHMGWMIRDHSASEQILKMHQTYSMTNW